MAVEVQGARLVLNLGNDRDAVCRMAVEEAVQSGTYVMHGDASTAPCAPSPPTGKGEYSGVIQRCRTSSEATGQQHPLLGLVESVQPAVRHVAERRSLELQQRRVAPGTALLHTDQATLHDVCKVGCRVSPACSAQHITGACGVGRGDHQDAVAALAVARGGSRSACVVGNACV